jgi:hypothetical protein
MTSRKRKVADFPEEYLSAWALAAEGKLSLSFDTEGKAMNFRQQLHAFRKAFVQENGQAACATWFKYDLIIDPRVDKFAVTCGLSDIKQQIREQLASTGVHPVVVPPPKIEAPTTLVPPGLGPEVTNYSAQSTAADVILEDAVAKGLERLGFTSKG